MEANEHFNRIWVLLVTVGTSTLLRTEHTQNFVKDIEYSASRGQGSYLSLIQREITVGKCLVY